MTLNKQTVADIAQLARLRIEDAEVEKYQTELSNILDLVEQMSECDTHNVAVMTHPFDASLRMRADDVTEENQREKFQRIAPAAENGFYLVPKVID
jgi:aspartyl-tRNA(Asn)/glutamyl-tRNA(Gln) amidotransferase subunit C